MPTSSTPTGSYKTSSLPESAVLHALGFSLADTEACDDRVEMVFTDPFGDAADTIRKHYDKQLQLNSFDFAEAFAWAKTVIFSARRRAGIPSYKGVRS